MIVMCIDGANHVRPTFTPHMGQLASFAIDVTSTPQDEQAPLLIKESLSELVTRALSDGIPTRAIYAGLSFFAKYDSASNNLDEPVFLAANER